jgi:hypothetical protein
MEVLDKPIPVAPVLAGLRILANEGRLEEARRALDLFLSSRVAESGGHGDCGLFAIELGLARLAERELRLAVRDSRSTPDEVVWLNHLATLQRDLDDADAEGRTRQRLEILGKPQPRLRELRAEPAWDSEPSPISQSSGRDTRAPSKPASTPVPPAHAAKSVAPPSDNPRPTPWPSAALSESPSPPSARSESAPTNGDYPPRPAQGVITRRTPEATPEGRTEPRLTPPTPGDIVRFLHLFHGREDVHARQWLSADGRIGYSPVQRPLTSEAFERHIGGVETLGVYPARADLTVCFFAIDIDITKTALEEARRSPESARNLRRTVHSESLRMAAVARSLGIELLLEDSGYKGRHLWGFLSEPAPMGLIRNFVKMLANAIAPETPELALELYPKQGRLESGQIGNLIKLPLGIHLRTGRRAWILDADGRPITDPWAYLRSLRRHRREDILDTMSRLRSAGVRDDPDSGPQAKRDDRPKAAPLNAPEAFSEADFSTHPELVAITNGCPVLRTLIERGLERRRLLHEEQMVLRHVLGHRAIGVLAANYVFRRCPEIGPETYLQSVLAGNPISCPKIRKRVPDVTHRVPCNCQFPTRQDHYPTPLLHLDEARARGQLDRLPAPKERPDPKVAEDWGRQVAHLREQVERLSRELLAAETALKAGLDGLEGKRIELPEGEWTMGSDGKPKWTPKG